MKTKRIKFVSSFYVLFSIFVSSHFCDESNHLENNIRLEKCSDYIDNFEKYKCVQEKYIYKSNRSIIFKIIKKNQIYSMKVQNKTDHSLKELAIFKEASFCPHVAPLQDSKVLESDFIIIIIPFYRLANLTEIVNDKHHLLNDSIIFKIYEKIIKAINCFDKFGIVHNDLSPDNIVLNTNFDPYIIDFNSSNNENDISIPRSISSFSSPEKVASFNDSLGLESSSKEDLYSSAAILYFMFQKKPPLDPQIWDYNSMISYKIVFQKGDLMDVIHLLQHSLVVKSLRLDVNEFYIKFFETMEKRSLDSVSEVSFFTLNNVHLSNMESSKKYKFVLIIVIACLFLLGILLSTLLCCKHIFRKMKRSIFKKKQRKGEEFLFQEIN
jgi:serine/threonine protein kinase